MGPRSALDDFAASDGPVRVIGHRGYSSRAPENTLAAFSLLCDEGVFGAELDVYRCASGEVVVIHDHNLQRTAGVPLSVTETPFDRLREHDVGRWFNARHAGERIPLLEEVFELASGRLFFDVEIKHYPASDRKARGDGVEAQTVRLIRRHGLARRCIVSSFSPAIVRRVRLLAPDIPVALIYARAPDAPSRLRRKAARLLSGATVMKPHHGLATAANVRWHRTMGRLVMPWTVDDPDVAATLAARGVDAIITNKPGEIRDALGQMSR